MLTNMRYINKEHTLLDADYDHPEYGVIPTTIDMLDDYRVDLIEFAKRFPEDITPFLGSKAEEDFIASVYDNRNANAKATRDQANTESIFLDGSEFDYNLDNIMAVLSEASIIGTPDEDTREWRLVDGTVRTTSLSELKAIVKLGGNRRVSIEDQYTIWKEDGMKNEFTIIESE